MAPVYVPDDLVAIDSQIHIHLSSYQENPIMTQDCSDSNSRGLEDFLLKDIFSRRRTVVIPVACWAGPCIIYMRDGSLCISHAGSCTQSAILYRGTTAIFNILASQTSSLDLRMALATSLELCSHHFFDVWRCGHLGWAWRPSSPTRRLLCILYAQDSHQKARIIEL